ncbi:MAG TPA: hypothetical protein VHA09_05540 [Nitrososphaera sp.]|nr:hypothetical protein [Nitrososphaera sp.]
MKIDKAISIELRDGQRVSLSLKETKELYKKLGKMLAEGGSGERRQGRRKAVGARNAGTEKKEKKKGRVASKKSKALPARKSSPLSRKVISLSDAKKQEILAHFNKEISTTPRTLSNILKGVSYSASQLPAIRSIIESQQGIRAKAKGKRTLYLKKRTAEENTARVKGKTVTGTGSKSATETMTAATN